MTARGGGQLSPAARWVRDSYAWACAGLYGKAAWAYDPVSWLVSAGHWDAWRALALDHVTGDRVLEIGYGTGHLLPALARRHTLVAGLDASPQMAVRAQRQLAGGSGQVVLAQGAGQAMPWADHAFDAIIATFPAPYIVAPETLAECARVLAAPGGRLVVSGLWVTPARASLARLGPVFYGAPRGSMVGNLTARLAACGFTANWIERRYTWARVGILVAELRGF